VPIGETAETRPTQPRRLADATTEVRALHDSRGDARAPWNVGHTRSGVAAAGDCSRRQAAWPKKEVETFARIRISDPEGASCRVHGGCDRQV
jgi:hypothetical protein